MLPELLNHHQELFLTILEPLIAARNWRQIWAVSATCKYLYEFITINIDIYRHYCKYHLVIKDIKYHTNYAIFMSEFTITSITLEKSGKVHGFYSDISCNFEYDLNNNCLELITSFKNGEHDTPQLNVAPEKYVILCTIAEAVPTWIKNLKKDLCKFRDFGSKYIDVLYDNA